MSADKVIMLLLMLAVIFGVQHDQKVVGSNEPSFVEAPKTDEKAEDEVTLDMEISEISGDKNALDQEIKSESGNNLEDDSKNDSESDEVTMEEKLFMDQVGVNAYCARAAIARLHAAGCGEVISAEILKHDKGYTVKVVDKDGEAYIAGLDRKGLIGTVFKDSTDGEPLYLPIE